MNDTLFSETIHSEQFQIGQSNVKHVNYGPCEILEVTYYNLDRTYYKIKIKESGLILKCISTKLSSMEV